MDEQAKQPELLSREHVEKLSCDEFVAIDIGKSWRDSDAAQRARIAAAHEKIDQQNTQLAQAALKIAALEEENAALRADNVKHVSECVSLTGRLSKAEAQLATVTAECAQLNNVLRQAGWGQGEIDSAAYTFDKLVQANREHVANLKRLREALLEIACGTKAWERDEMIDYAQAALRGGKEGG